MLLETGYAMESHKDIVRLIRCSLIGNASEKERQDLEEWCRESEEHLFLFDKICKEVRVSVEGPVFCSLDDEKAWLKFKRSVRMRKRLAYGRRVLKYAALLALPLAVWTVFWFSESKVDTGGEALRGVETIAPGTACAVLVAADGKIHELDGAPGQQEIEVESGIRVKRKGGNLAYDALAGLCLPGVPAVHTLRVPRGGEFELTLSDGTHVCLNAATELTYPVRFDGRERRVFLSGEAYFEVKEDKKRPFYVVTDEVQIQVYGTEFNVNTHERENIQTVLVRGKVGIKKCGAAEEWMMKPGERACFDRKSGRFDVKRVDVRQYVAWKDGYFAFEDRTLEQIMDALALWYDVEVVFQTEKAKKLVFTGYMKRYEEVNEILNAMTDVVGVRFTIDKQTIIVHE